jgi:hypothetical protein
VQDLKDKTTDERIINSQFSVIFHTFLSNSTLHTPDANKQSSASIEFNSIDGYKRAGLKFSLHITRAGTSIFIQHDITALLALAEEDDFDCEVVPTLYQHIHLFGGREYTPVPPRIRRW